MTREESIDRNELEAFPHLSRRLLQDCGGVDKLGNADQYRNLYMLTDSGWEGLKHFTKNPR